MNYVGADLFKDVCISGFKIEVGIFWPGPLRTKKTEGVGVFYVVGLIKNQRRRIGVIAKAQQCPQGGDGKAGKQCEAAGGVHPKSQPV